jgi:hypothetical protein
MLNFISFLSILVSSEGYLWSQTQITLILFSIYSIIIVANVSNVCQISNVIEENFSSFLTHSFENERQSFVIVSYATPDVFNYAVYSASINSLFAEENNYSFHMTTPELGFEFDNIDQRWNKVHILDVLMRDKTNVKYLVWLDADLVFVDFSFRLESVTALHPLADVIISAETMTENGLVNTGCIIIKNSEWSLKFLSAWWNTTDRSTGMDQHVFDLLWKKNTLDMQSHIAILPPDVINSRFPITRYHNDNSHVLHLAGASSAVRRHVFRHACQILCSAVMTQSSGNNTQSLSRILPPQIGLTSSFLQSLDYTAIQIAAMSDILSDMNDIRPAEQLEVEGFLVTLSQVSFIGMLIDR